MTDTASFYHVLVVGAAKTGKTSILSSLCHNLPIDYEPTVTADKFVDVQRKIVFIDTPGIKDTMFINSSGAKESNQIRFSTFYDDALVKELRGGVNNAEDCRLFADPYCASKIVNNLNSVDAVLILYTNCKSSQRVAKGLRFMYHRKILEDEALRDSGEQIEQAAAASGSKLKIFTVKVVGDFNRKDVFNAEHFRAQLNAPQVQDKQRNNNQFNDDIECVYNDEPVVDVKQKYETCVALPDVNISKESTVDEALFRMHSQLGVILNLEEHEDFHNVDNTASNNREQCGNCVIA